MIPLRPTPNPKIINRSNDEWRNILTPEQFRVGIKEGTERPFSDGNHNDEKRDGFSKETRMKTKELYKKALFLALFKEPYLAASARQVTKN